MARIYLAGAESIELLKLLVEQDTTDVMLSFFYVQQRGALPQIIHLLKQHPDLRVFLDSGSTSFLKKDRGDPQLYWRAYYDVLKEHGHRFEYASEFDIDGYAWKHKDRMLTVSPDQLDAWRDDLQELGTVQIVPVWHVERGKEAWEQFCKDARFPHLAIGDAPISKGEVGKLVAQAHGWKKTVHGYGALAGIGDLPVTHFDTISSGGWLVGQKFGDALIFKGGHLSRIYANSKEGKKERKKHRKYFTSIGVDPDKIEQDDRTELNKANIRAWNNLSKRLQLVSPHKGPQRATLAPESTQTPSRDPQHPSQPSTLTEAAIVSKMDILPRDTSTGKSVIPLQPVDSLVVEKEEELAISLPEPKPFMPKIAGQLLCASCAMSTDCPKFREDAVCAFQDEFAKVSTRDANEVVDELAAIFSVNVERARYLRLWEQISGGGVVSPEVTKHMTETFQMGAKLAELMKGKKRTVTTASGQGVFDKFFGGIGPSKPAQITGESEDAHEDETDDLPAAQSRT